MATLKSEQYTNQTASPVVLGSQVDSEVFSAKYTLLGTESTGDTVQFFELPAEYIAVAGSLAWEVGGTGTTIAMSLGDGTTATAFVTAQDLKTAGGEVFEGTVAPASTATVVTGTLTTSGATLTAGAQIWASLVAVRSPQADFVS